MDPARILKGLEHSEQLHIKIENPGEIDKFTEKLNCISVEIIILKINPLNVETGNIDIDLYFIAYTMLFEMGHRSVRQLGTSSP